MKKRTHFVLIAALALARVAAAQTVDFAKQEIQTVKIADGIYILMGGPAQGNILASVGPDGIFLVDSMYAPMHQKIMDALGKISTQPIRFLVNTHLHSDHTAGNEAMAKLGAVIISQDNMRSRMAKEPRNQPIITYTDSMALHFNGDDIYIFHPAPAHTDGDSIVYFRKANVMHVGDVPASLRYPNIGVNEGGTVEGMIAAGRQVMQVANENTKIIPGHLGPVVGFAEIRQQLVMFEAVRDRVAAAIRAGQSLDQVRALFLAFCGLPVIAAAQAISFLPPHVVASGGSEFRDAPVALPWPILMATASRILRSMFYPSCPREVCCSGTATGRLDPHCHFPTRRLEGC